MSFEIPFMPPGNRLPACLLAAALALADAHPAAGGAFSGTMAGVLDPAGAPALPPEEKAELFLPDAMRLALLRNPELAAFAKERHALEGLTLQAGLLPNPELSVMAENAGNFQRTNTSGTSIKEVEQQDTMIRIQQLIELGGKRAARVKAAMLNEDLAVQAYEVKRLALMTQVADGFTEVLAGQEQLRLAQENRQLARDVADAVARRVEAGKVAPIEHTRMEVALAATEIALVQAQRDLASARKRLALLWSSPAPQFERAVGHLESWIDLPGLETLVERVLASPMALHAAKNMEQRQALLEVERTRRIPNLTLVAGILNHSQTGGTTAVAGISLPLQIFDRNQGNLLAAHRRANKAMDERAATELRLRSELTQAHEAWSATRNEVRALRDDILPKAAAAFEATRKGYELGKFGFLEVLDAQRTLFQHRVLYVRALSNHRRLVNEIERLIAAPTDGAADALAVDGADAHGIAGSGS
ncbi:TolC family protein [Nitrosovibrio sp. Nv17]|uniref:TolC family protein n=1 Tax=Nitrosovibrio sp. Nv17 TaxID=1855339 RepID=UPI000908BD69|nr:TolC family protein [Nitrosovibrio sp. Nv17]SFW11601.1 outer membrane protein, cobalt-zinc-cadmium efflux system [Nitrosovibrio sp. Nv17]